MNRLTRYLVESVLLEEAKDITVLLPGGLNLHMQDTYI